MAKRIQIPEEFIRDLIKRGFNRDQILSRASKKDLGFYRLVTEILNHTTLIEKIEQQVEGINQSSINFEKQSYSSKTIIDDIQKEKDKNNIVSKKPKDNGRSNLPIHTDIAMDDLQAPLPDIFKTKKLAFTISTDKKNGVAEYQEMSLFDEIPESSETQKDKTERKLKLFPLIQKESTKVSTTSETSKLPESKSNSHETAIGNKTATPDLPKSETEKYEDLEKEKLLNIIKQKEVLLSELNRNLGQKEATSHVERLIAVETKTKQAEVIKDLRQKSSIYRMGLYVTIGVFFCAVAIIKAIGSKPSESPLPITNNYISPIVKIDEIPNTNDTMQLINPNERDNQIVIDYPHTDNDQDLQAPQRPANEITHQVKKGESLWKITGKYLGKDKSYLYKKVMEYNGLTSDVAPVGKTIKIPSLAELEE